MRKCYMPRARVDGHTWPSAFPVPSVSVLHWPWGMCDLQGLRAHVLLLKSLGFMPLSS